MKFILHIGPVIPASPAEREELRLIFHSTDKVQLIKMPSCIIVKCLKNSFTC